jgi:Ca2+-binding EF-hand superfamily protein
LQDLNEVFKKYDVNGDGNMDYKEFSSIFLEGKQPSPNQEQADPYL